MESEVCFTREYKPDLTQLHAIVRHTLHAYQSRAAVYCDYKSPRREEEHRLLWDKYLYAVAVLKLETAKQTGVPIEFTWGPETDILLEESATQPVALDIEL